MLALVLVPVCIGCGAPDPLSAQVSGSVSYDGQALENGIITFRPADGQGPTAGDAITAGKYSVKMMPGEKIVEISASKIVGEEKVYADMPDSPMRPKTVALVPDKYNIQSELKYSAAAGANTQDFSLPK